MTKPMYRNPFLFLVCADEVVKPLTVVAHPETGDSFQVTIDYVKLGQAIHLQVDAQPFFHVQFSKRVALHPQGGCNPEGTQVVVQVDDGIETFCFQLPQGQLITCSGKV